MKQNNSNNIKKRLNNLKIILIFFILGSLLIAGCNHNEKFSAKKNDVQIANPASVYCMHHGGKLEIKSGPKGEYGICIMKDFQCEEWAFYRGECGPKNHSSSGIKTHNSKSEACTMEYKPVCGVDGKTYSNKCIAGSIKIIHNGVCNTNNSS